MGRPTGLHFHGEFYVHPHIVKMVQKTVEILNTMFLNSKCVIYTLTCSKNFIQLLLTTSDSELTTVIPSFCL